MNEASADVLYTLAFMNGAQQERERILKLIKSYWCYEVGCNIHITDWPTFIMEIKGEKK